MWDIVELDALGSPGMRRCFLDHGYGCKCGDMFSHEGNYAVGGAGPGHPPYLGLKKRTFECPQDFPYQYQHYEDNYYPKYRVDCVKPKNLDYQINQFKMKDNHKQVTKFPTTQNCVTVPHKELSQGNSQEWNFS